MSTPKKPRSHEPAEVVDITVGLEPAVVEPEAATDGADTTTAAVDAHGRLPADSQSLWWPDRNAQIVQATSLTPKAAADFLRSTLGQDGDRLRINKVTEHSPNEFEVQAELAVRLTRWRKVQLRIYPTPSGNLSVIEMLPRRAWMPQTERYLAAGVPAITALTDQMEELPTPPPE